jgi:uncharacterized protein involved in exopolysaccharide biosynthesis
VAASRARDLSGNANLARLRTPLNADTSSEPHGLTRRVMLNILEAFFRRPWLHLLPLILLCTLGAASVLSMTPNYRSVGTLNATGESLLNDLTDAANTPGLTFESPAVVTARQINQLLRTDFFLSRVAKEAGLGSAIEDGALLKTQIRQYTGASADGDNLIRVSSTSRNAELSERLAKATMTSYVNWVVESEVSESTGSADFLVEQVKQAQADVDAAWDDVQQYILDHPLAENEKGPLAERLQLQRLQDVLDRSQNRHDQALNARDAAQLATAQARVVVQQRLQTVDEPEIPTAPEPRLRKAAMTLFLFGAVGALLSLALVVMTATLDRTIRVPNDITAKFGLDVLAVVPDKRR